MIDLASIFPQFYLTKDPIVRQQYSLVFISMNVFKKKSFIISSLTCEQFIFILKHFPTNLIPRLKD